MLIIADASPLIALADAGELDLVRLAFGEILIPEEVNREVFKSDRYRVKPSWIKVRALTDPVGIEAFAELRKSLDRGESQAIALGSVFDAIVLIDEELGTLECNRRKIACMSTGEMVAQLRTDGVLAGRRANQVVAKLRMHGVYV
jgi:predicted nucleic acid-binding protein